MKPEDIKIDPEFRDLLCVLTEYENKALEGSLLSHGCLTPLIVEEKLGVLIDGHNRLRICKEHDIPFEVKTIMLGGREPAEKWIIRNQLGRRNLTPERLKVYIAQLYQREKKKAGFEEGNEANSKGVNQYNRTRGQNDHATKTAETAKKIAEQVGKSEKTVRRYDKEVEAVEKAGKLKEYESGKLPKAEVKKIVEESKPVRKQTKAEAQEEAEVLSLHVDNWLDDEIERKETVSNGQAVLANAERDKNLIQWAETKGLAVRIDRRSPYGNPFILGKDGNRDEVCDYYKNQYLPYKASIKKELLRGKVLICHCYPERCHGESLIES